MICQYISLPGIIATFNEMSQTENRSAGNLWKTGVVYDESMAEAKCLWDDEYNERPERYTHILKRYPSIVPQFIAMNHLSNSFWFDSGAVNWSSLKGAKKYLQEIQQSLSFSNSILQR